MKIRFLVPVILSALLSFKPAHGAFTDHGFYSTDTTTELDWLDTTQTIGLTYNQISSGAGGWLAAGWRYAHGDEVRQLFSLYIDSNSGAYVYDDIRYNQSLAFVRQMGVNISFNNLEGVVQNFGPNYPNQISIDGIYNDLTANSRVGLGDLIARAPGIQDSVTPNSPFGMSRWVAYDDFPSEFVTPDLQPLGFGSFLVRASSIPEPSLTMLGLLASCLLLLRRRC